MQCFSEFFLLLEHCFALKNEVGFVHRELMAHPNDSDSMGYSKASTHLNSSLTKFMLSFKRHSDFKKGETCFSYRKDERTWSV